MRHLWLLVALAGCNNDYGVHDPDKVPPAQPPGTPDTTQGAPPEWNSCFQGWRGVYYNLRVTDDYVDPRPRDPAAPDTPDAFPYWDLPEAFQSFDPSLDFGLNWWPVDEGLEGDPKFFAVHWDAWLKNDGGDFQFLLGSQDDAWVYIKDGGQARLLAARPGIQEYTSEVYDIPLGQQQYPIDVWFIHRGSENSGFSFRPIGGNVKICYPDFGTPAE